jgi:hypothetical protein
MATLCWWSLSSGTAVSNTRYLMTTANSYKSFMVRFFVVTASRMIWGHFGTLQTRLPQLPTWCLHLSSHDRLVKLGKVQRHWEDVGTVVNNAVMGFWTVQRGLIRQFFTHNAYNLICRQLFNPNMPADLPWQTSTHKCQIELPNRIAELSNRIRFAKLNCQTELPNQTELTNCRTELPYRIAQPNCWTELPNWLNCRTELPKNWIVKRNCQTELNWQIELPNWICELNCPTEFVLLNWIAQKTSVENELQ